MADPIPPADWSTGLMVDDVRMFLLDRTPADNALELDLFFSDPEILAAMRFAVMKFNEMPPLVQFLSPSQIPYGWCFLNGISYALYLAKLAQLQRNDIDYNAGNMNVEINKRRIAHILELLPVFKEDFETGAKAIKVTINLEAAYRCF